MCGLQSKPHQQPEPQSLRFLVYKSRLREPILPASQHYWKTRNACKNALKYCTPGNEFFSPLWIVFNCRGSGEVRRQVWERGSNGWMKNACLPLVKGHHLLQNRVESPEDLGPVPVFP